MTEQLTTLGSLALEGSDNEVRSLKALALLAYLGLEGRQERWRVAGLLWPKAKDKLNSLSNELRVLRRDADGSFGTSKDQVWTNVASDAEALQGALDAHDHRRAVALYAGSFLAGANLSRIGVDFEDWVVHKREAFAKGIREAHLALAQEDASRERFAEAAGSAEAAYQLESAPELDPTELSRYYTFLRAARHPLAATLQEEAADFDITLQLTPEEARKRLRPTFVGRKQELARLRELKPGDWAWLHGAAGMGKTALLRSLDGTYLVGRSGKPYATLEPLLGSTAGKGKDWMLEKLGQAQGTWLLDNWEWMDSESRQLLRDLRDARPGTTVVIASRLPPQFKVDATTTLGRLTRRDLANHPGAIDDTDGLPALVEAHLRGEPLVAALEERLAALPEEARRVYLALALLDQTDTALVRRALELSAADVAASLEVLIGTGLIDSSHRVQALQAAGDFLDAHPQERGALALQLARQLEGADAFPLYRRAHGLWDASDHEAVQRSYVSWAEELISLADPLQASEILREAPPSEAVTLLRARALEKAGRYLDALALLEGSPETPPFLAVLGTVYWRLGRSEEAEEASERVLKAGRSKAPRAEALNTLGHIARSRGDYARALGHTQRSATLWRTLGRHLEYAGALNNLFITKALAGEEYRAAFDDAVAAAGDNSLLLAPVFLNLGFVVEESYDRSGDEADFEEARRRYREAAGHAENGGAKGTAALAHMNIGVMHHRRDQHPEAEEAYELALALANEAGDERVLGMVMANLAELHEEFYSWDEALHILEEAGQFAVAQSLRDGLPEDHAFRKHFTQDAP